ncbi:MAG: hypothetical protein H5T84_07715, partial [Thermoleophilia bacterium]|nr:hypothetical protein [Thermoleophilia bacterium]
LVAKALRVVAAATGWTITGVVTIHKGIPLAAGLGGGSADAAVALGVGSRVVAEAGGPALEEQDLWRLARSLGADVPFFLDPRPAIGRGIGDLLEPLELPPVPGVLVAMTRELSTAEVFSTFEELFGGESAGHFADRAAALVECWETLSARWHGAQLDWDQMVDLLSRLLINDLEAASFHLLPELRDVKAALLAAGAAGALMSGSGPAVFGICRTEAEADHIAQVLQAGGLAARRVQLGGVGSAP